MARAQIYRGNPEEKKYIIFDNFSGGMNTTAIDDAMLTNEYRSLENVDLSTTGLIQNRKGFEKLQVLNALITQSQPASGDYYSINLADFYNYSMIRVISDENNIFDFLNNCETLAEFSDKTQGLVYVLKILFIAQTVEVFEGATVTATRANVLEISNSDVLMWKTGRLAVPTTNKKITGVTVIPFDNKLYIPLNQINDTLEGFWMYDSDLDNMTVVNSLYNFYVPNPYEVSNIGFNILAADPLNQIALYESGVAEIRSMFLTKTDNDAIVLLKIPTDGVFTLNVIFKGSLIAADLIPTVYVTDFQGVNTDLPFEYIINDTNARDGILKYDISVRLEEVEEINIKVRKLSQKVDYDIDFATTAVLLAYYQEETILYLTKPTINTFNCYEPIAGAGAYGYSYVATVVDTITDSDTTHTTSNINASNLPYITTDSNSNILTYSSSLSQSNSASYAVRKDLATSPVSYKLVVVFYGAYGTPLSFKTPATGLVTFNGGVIADIMTYTPDYSTLIRVGADPTFTYYRYNGGTAGLIADFTLQTEEDLDLVILSYIDVYDIGQEENLKEIETIDTSEIDLIEIKNRLVMYGGNTILFSDYFKFNYFPNYNYVTLALDSGDSIQKIAYFRGSYIIFTKERLYRMSGEFGAEDFKIVLINDSIGCVASDSVRSINNTLVFLSRDGLYSIKQNFYMDGLENVEKIDKNIKDLIPYSTKHESLVYNEQYLLFMKDADDAYYKTLKQYYNMEYRNKTFPYVLDEYSVVPNNLFMYNGAVYSIKNGLFYKYDEGYTDFLPATYLDEDVVNYMYKMSITTPNYSLGYPTHNKKFKNVYLKTDSNIAVLIYVTLYLNNSVWKTPYEFVAIVNEFGEIEYNEILGDTVYTTTASQAVLGTFYIGETTLGGTGRYQIHKVVTSAKGKTLALKIEQKLNVYFALQDIGILYKLGKIKEMR